MMTIDMHLTLPPGFVEYVRRVSLDQHIHTQLIDVLHSHVTVFFGGRGGVEGLEIG